MIMITTRKYQRNRDGLVSSMKTIQGGEMAQIITLLVIPVSLAMMIVYTLKLHLTQAVWKSNLMVMFMQHQFLLLLGLSKVEFVLSLQSV